MKLTWILLFILLALPATRHAGSNVMVRFATTVQIVEQGTLALGPYAPLTIDAAIYQGKTYLDKAPGESLLLVPVYAFVRLFTADFDQARHFCRLLSLTVLTLFTTWFFWYRLPSWGVQGLIRHSAAITYAVGTTAWPFFVMLYCHGFVANFILLGVLWLADYRGEQSRKRCLILSGLAFGLATTFEYPAIALALMAGFYLLSFERRWGRLVLFGSFGAILPILIIGGFNYAAFDHPLRFGYVMLKYPYYYESMKKGLMGIHLPSWQHFLLIAISPSKGLFFWSPVLFIGVYGLFCMVRKRMKEGLLLAALVTAYFFIISGFYESGGGANLGPRYLVPVIGPLVLSGAWLAEEKDSMGRSLFLALAMMSSLLVWAGLFSDPQMQESLVNPLWDFAIPMLLEGKGPGNLPGLPDNVASIVGLLILAATWLVVLIRKQQLPDAASAKAAASPDKPQYHRFYLTSVVLLVVLAFYTCLTPHLRRTDKGFLHEILGNHFMLRGDYGRSVEEYEMAMSLRPNPWILYYQAKAYAKMGDQLKVDEVLRRLLRTDPFFLEKLKQFPEGR